MWYLEIPQPKSEMKIISVPTSVVAAVTIIMPDHHSINLVDAGLQNIQQQTYSTILTSSMSTYIKLNYNN